MPQLDFAETRRRISIRQVLELIGYQPCRTAGHQWRGPCPICQPSPRLTPGQYARCFSANVRVNLFQCFRCHRSGNALDLWVDLTGLPLYQATLDLCAKLNIQPVTIENPQPPTSV